MEAVQEFLIKIADDALIYGHRNSEWTGLAPTLEEDIAFSSMSQDKVGHAWFLYKLLNEKHGFPDPDKFGFLRKANEYRCCHLTEIYTQDFGFALMRQFLFDHAEYLRYDLLKKSSYLELAQFAAKVSGEIKYHLLHADTWVAKLANGTEESKARLQTALNECWPLALGIFEEGPFEQELKEQGVFPGEKELEQAWTEKTISILSEAGLNVPEKVQPVYGGRKGYHSDDIQQLLNEMSEVLSTEPDAEW